MSKVFSQSDVASHSKSDDIWIIINNDVFDVTKFQDTHPGGKKSMKAIPYFSKSYKTSAKPSSNSHARCRRQRCHKEVSKIP
jgi:cytochrome b involved in lipid metabolism